MILCVTPNPALDHTLTVPSWQLGIVNRAEKGVIAAGGKGVNVARVVKALRGEAFCMGLLGGESGRMLAARAAAEGLRGKWSWGDGETRTCVIVTTDGREDTVINEPGAALPADWAGFHADVVTAGRSAAIVTISGSLPQGISPAALPALISAVQEAGAPVWVDASGEALRAAVEAAPAGVKVNGNEAAALVGGVVVDEEAAVTAAQQICSWGIAAVVITLGEKGAVWVDGTGAWGVAAPRVTAVSATGSGDSFLAALLAARTAGLPPETALRWAAAAGAANALQKGGGAVRYETWEQLLAVTASSYPIF
jgi:1-phosphofructokinase family hexose kinase